MPIEGSGFLIESIDFLFLFFLQNFDSNPYFEDAKLTKTFTFLDEGTTNVTSTTIKWKEGMVRYLLVI